MGETSKFLTLSFTASAVVAGCILSARSITTGKAMARVFCLVSIVLSLGAAQWIVLDSLGSLPTYAASQSLLQILIYRGWVVIGTGISSAVVMLLATGMRLQIRDATRSFLTSPYVLGGLCLSVSISFVCTEIGKLAHKAEMRQFFIESGYPAWFLYFVIAAETVGAVGLLVPRTRIPAAVGLIFIMAGAIATHARNRDPFSDSLEALHLLVILVCIVVMCLLRNGLLPRGDDTGSGRTASIGESSAEA